MNTRPTRFIIWLFAIQLILTSCNKNSYQLPEEAGVIDVTKSPYFADNTGETDCSEAIQKAFDYAVKRTKGIYTNDERALQILYFPKGTYMVSKPLVLVSKEVKKHRNENSKILKKYISGHMMIYGESKEETKIRLADYSPDFQVNETPVIRFLEYRNTNTSYFNGIRNVTIEIGLNNPKASAVEFVSSNIGGIQNVAIINHDTKRPAFRGLSLPIQKGGLALIKDVTIKGFKTGIFVTGDFPGYTFENINLLNQSVVGIQNVGKNIVIHNLNSQNTVPVVNAKSQGSITTILDGTFLGGDKNNPAIINEGHMLLRNIKFEGYNKILKDVHIKTEDNILMEYASSSLGLFDNAPTTSLNLPIKATPDYPFPKASQWSIFDVTRQEDDTKALQELIDSDVEYVFISGVNEKLSLSGTIFLRGNLKILHGGWTNMHVNNKGSHGQPLFHFQDGKHDLMILEGFSNGQHRNTFTTFLNDRNKTLVIRDVFMGYGHVSYRNKGTGDLFLENVVTGGGDYPELPEHTLAGWLIENQNVWFRNLNPEEWVPDLHIGKGAKVMGMGGKLGELYGTHLKVTDGGKAELYGIMCNINRTVHHKYGLDIHKPSMTSISIEVENADLSLGAFHDGFHHDPDSIFIREIQKLDTILLLHRKSPLRTNDKEHVATPLYRSNLINEIK